MNTICQIEFIANEGMAVDIKQATFAGKVYSLAKAEYTGYILKTAVDSTTASYWKSVFQEKRDVEQEMDACLAARNNPNTVLTYASMAPVESNEFRSGFLDQCRRVSATFFSTFVAFKKEEDKEIPLFRVGIAQGYDSSELPAERVEAAKAYLEERQLSPLYTPSSNEVQVGIVPTFDADGKWNEVDYWVVKMMACSLGLKLAKAEHTKPFNWTRLKDGTYFEDEYKGRVDRITATNPVASLYALDDTAQQEKHRQVLSRKSQALHTIGLRLLGYLAPKDLDPRNYGSTPREVWGFEV